MLTKYISYPIVPSRGVLRKVEAVTAVAEADHLDLLESLERDMKEDLRKLLKQNPKAKVKDLIATA